MGGDWGWSSVLTGRQELDAYMDIQEQLRTGSIILVERALSRGKALGSIPNIKKQRTA
jgi:hypothetical protein